MTRLERICVVLFVCWGGVVLAGSVKVSLLQPQGIRFIYPDESGVSLVAYHYNINQPLVDVEAGQYAVDVNAKTGSEWVHENVQVTIKPGDKVYYWYLVVKDGQGHTVNGQVWTAVVPTTKPLTPPSTTTNSAPVIKPIATQTHNNNQQQTQAPTHNSGQQSSSNGDVSGTIIDTSCSDCTCQCTGGAIREPSCTSFPCLIFEDEFNTLNLDVWEHEITAGGGGNWEFQYYTNNRSNSYVRDGKLFIKPTLTVDALADGPDSLTRGALDIWGSQPGDVCTGNAFWGCRRDGNPEHIINPIQSARLRSSRGLNFKYGKVEIRAKMPTGDWLWPAIWLLPLRNAYGKWPASGEIDIVESRGNKDYHDDKGNDQSVKNAGSTLHFGSDFFHNKYPTAHGERLSKTGTYGDGFHIYTLIWDEDHISISMDGEEVINVAPTNTMWEYGGLDKDGVENPWAAGTKMAPFDQKFFLILNVAVGGTTYFQDNWQSPSGKPWRDDSDSAPRDFWNQKNTWYPTWNPDTNNGEDAAMQVDYIRVWKLKQHIT